MPFRGTPASAVSMKMVWVKQSQRDSSVDPLRTMNYREQIR
jgi:hypothetical protein